MNAATSSNNTSPRIALITGGSRGLGKNAALHLARQGVGILFTYVGNRTAADATVSEIEALGVPVAALQLDLADSASFTAFAQQVSDALYRHWQASQFNYLVNNGGMGIYGAIAETSEADFDALYKVHLKAPSS
jgi:NAD(P)-dependent dehydrogenase (short-subunit alcohol dehydrogenase family)